MLGKIKWGVVALCVMVLLFNFMPTGHSAAEVMAGFESSVEVQGSQQASKLVSMYSAVEAGPDSPRAEVSGTRELVCTIALRLAYAYGCGYDQQGEYHHSIQWFHYCVDNPGVDSDNSYSGKSGGNYANYQNLSEHVISKINGSSSYDYQNISCAAWGTFIWSTVLDMDVYQRGGGGLGRENKDILLGQNGTLDEVLLNARPGDLIECYCHADQSWGKHTEIYIGPYTITDPDGTVHEYQHAICHSSMDSDGWHVMIKELEQHTHSPSQNDEKTAWCHSSSAGRQNSLMYVLPLDKFMEKYGITESDILSSQNELVQAVLGISNVEIGSILDLQTGGI